MKTVDAEHRAAPRMTGRPSKMLSHEAKVQVLLIEQEPVAATVCSRRLRKRIELNMFTRKAFKESREIAHSKLLRSPREAAS